MEQKKIFVITPNYAPEIGACASRMKYLCESMQNDGAEVFVLTTNPNYPTGKIYPSYRNTFFSNEQIEGVNVWRVWFFPLAGKHFFGKFAAQIFFSIMIWLFFFRIKKLNAAAFIVQTPPLFLAFSAVLMAKLLRKKILVNFSDLYPQVLIDLKVLKKGIIFKTLLQIEKFIINKADFITGQSEEIIEYLAKKNPLKPPFLYRNGIDKQAFRQNRTEKTGTCQKIVYAGLLGFSQNILDVCNKLNVEKLAYELHIYGAGAEKEGLEKLLKDKSIKNIFLHEPVPHDKIPALLQNFDIALIPTRSRIYGTLPSKIYEAMAAGLIPVYLGEGEGAEIASAIGFSVASKDYLSLENKLKQLKNMPYEKIKEMKEDAEKFSIQFEKENIYKNFSLFFLKKILFDHENHKNRAEYLSNKC